MNPKDDRKQKVFSCVKESVDSIFYHIKANKSFVSNDEGIIYGVSYVKASVNVIRITTAQDSYHSDCVKKLILSIADPAKANDETIRTRKTQMHIL